MRSSSTGTAGRTSRRGWRVGHRPHRTTTIPLASGNVADWRLWYSSTPLTDTNWLRDIAGKFIGDESRASLWFASPGVRASLHFDASPNIVLTLAGVKKVTLVSSTHWRRLSLYPALHPAARQSRIDDATHFAAIGEFTEIARGEALYLPPLYLHAVQTVTDEPALSVNAYLSENAKAAARDLSSAADFSKFCGKCALIHFALAAALSPRFVQDVVTSRYNGLEEDYAYFEKPSALVSRDPLPTSALFDRDPSCWLPPTKEFVAFVTSLIRRAEAAGLTNAIDILLADRLEVEAFKLAGSNFSFVGPLLNRLSLVLGTDAPFICAQSDDPRNCE